MPTYATSSAPGFTFPSCRGPWRAKDVPSLLETAFQERMDAVPHESIAGAFHVQRPDGTRVGTVYELPEPQEPVAAPVEDEPQADSEPVKAKEDHQEDADALDEEDEPQARPKTRKKHR